MNILKQLVFYLWVVVKAIFKFLFVLSRNYSLRYAQYLLWEFTIGIALAIIFRPNSELIIQYTVFLFMNLLFYSSLFWLLTFLYKWRYRKSRKFEKDLKYDGFLHNCTDINDVIAEIDNLKASIIEWAGADKNTALKKVKTLRIYYKSSTTKKAEDFLANTSIGIILGLISGLILKPDVMNAIKSLYGNEYSLISDSMMNYINALTLLITGLMIASKILIENHRVTKSTQLYEEVLEDVVTDLEDEIKSESNLGT
ncbi:hypothetical protein MOE47_05880 [Bacillus atrophaeus]|uniref:hypothetical protein n=1 Tax=Bacillus atrophaeus TaxID=1452 RepID=UPI00227DC88B|nr:hypothetical protein [Bacillus atrophaeus]MCY8912540.1 hypothetical protein [Bacillus atrophaeus]MCY9113962.1 hypothetical protein [Bacillus atrophaeus]MEC0927093.1 hypothetical protein [Bacillus atrophaeus]MEC0932067.1 hypothetical protein [Bacillus atrophaeus]